MPRAVWRFLRGHLCHPSLLQHSEWPQHLRGNSSVLSVQSKPFYANPRWSSRTMKRPWAVIKLALGLVLDPTRCPELDTIHRAFKPLFRVLQKYELCAQQCLISISHSLTFSSSVTWGQVTLPLPLPSQSSCGHQWNGEALVLGAGSPSPQAVSNFCLPSCHWGVIF